MSALSQALDGQGQFEEARTLSEQAFRLRTEVLSPEHPETLISMHILATVMYHQGQVAEARELLEKTVTLRRRVLGPGHAHTLLSVNALAWLLATASDPNFRDPPRAVEMAKDVVERASKDADKWTTLGAAHYRAGQWTDAIAALEKSEATAPRKPLAPNAFFLAMAHWQRGEIEEARRWHRAGTGRIDKTKPEDSDSLRCQAEAAKLLGLPNP